MKALLIVALVLLVLLVGLPFAMGMADMATCPACSAPGTTFVVAMCLAILAVGGVYIALSLKGRASQRAAAMSGLLLAVDLDRPPQHA